MYYFSEEKANLNVQTNKIYYRTGLHYDLATSFLICEMVVKILFTRRLKDSIRFVRKYKTTKNFIKKMQENLNSQLGRRIPLKVLKVPVFVSQIVAAGSHLEVSRPLHSQLSEVEDKQSKKN